MRNKKILIISHKFHPDIGGIETHTETLAQNFLELGYQVKVMTWSTGGNLTFDYVVIRNPGLSKQVSALNWCDIVLENNPSLRLSWPLLFIKRKHVVVIQTWLNKHQSHFNYQAGLKKIWLNKADGVIAISNIIKKLVFPQATIVPNAYNASDFYDLNSFRSKSFVFLGRLVSDKGADMAIQLLSCLKEKFNRNFELTIVGSGPEEESLKALAAKNQLTDQITFTGNLKGSALNAILNEHQFLIVPSRWQEPFGIVALEGIASGCIPIVSDESGLVDAVGDAGIIFKRNNLNSLCEEVISVINDTDKLKLLREHGKSHIKKFTGREIALKTIDVLENL